MLYIFCSELEVHGRGWSFSGAGYGLYKTHTHNPHSFFTKCLTAWLVSPPDDFAPRKP